MPQNSSVLLASWEYMMPKRKERMAGYIRESDISLANSTTIESAAKAVREYGEKEGYIYEPTLEFKEAISSVTVAYTEREKLIKMLDAAKRKEFDVLVVTEIRAISRRQVEVLVIYDMLQKYGVRLETIKEKFGDDAMSKAILSLRSMFVEIEVEQSKMRMQRGRSDRLAIGGAPNAHPKAAYGYVFINTDKEVKGGYQFNTTIMFVDENGKEWSEYTVVLFIFDLFLEGSSIHNICRTLNDLHIPPPKKALKGEPHWQKGSLYAILINPIYCGEVWANRFKGVKSEKSGKLGMVSRPREEWIRLPDAPAILTKEQFDAAQRQLEINKEDSLRNNKKDRAEIGLLRCGHIFCGICGRKMSVNHPSEAGRKNGNGARYGCEQYMTTTPGISRHRVTIGVHDFDHDVHDAIKDVLRHPTWVRERVAELRKKPEPIISQEDIQSTIDGVKTSLKNLYALAAHATDDDTIADLAQQMNELERRKQQAQALLFNLSDDNEEDEALEAELMRFEKWAESVKPQLTDPTYQPDYNELRLAVRIIGIRAVIYPTKGEYEFRWQIFATVPEVLKKLDCNKISPLLKSSSAAA